MLSGRNRELPALIAREKPDSLTAPAALAGRNESEPVLDIEDDVAMPAGGIEGRGLRHVGAAGPHRDREAADLAEWVADRDNRVAFGRRKRPSPIRAVAVSVEHRGECAGGSREFPAWEARR